MARFSTRDLEVTLSGASQGCFAWLAQHGVALDPDGVRLHDDAHPLAARVQELAAALKALASDLGEWSALHLPDDDPDAKNTRCTLLRGLANFTGEELDERVLKFWRELPRYEPA